METEVHDKRAGEKQIYASVEKAAWMLKSENRKI